MGRVLVAVIICLAALAGATSAAHGANDKCVSPAKWTGQQATHFEVSCIICKARAPRLIALSYSIASTDPTTIARRYAQKSQPPRFRQSTFEGCVRGFRLRGVL